MNTMISESKSCEMTPKAPGISRIISGLEHQECRSREAAQKVETILSQITGQSIGNGGTEENRQCQSIDDRINLLLESIAENNERANSACDALMEYLSS